MKKQFIALILVFLIVTMPLTYAQVTGTSDPEFVNQEKEEIPPGEDILVNVASYQPKVVPQQAFETDDYTGYNVYALLTGIQTNPFIDITKIRSISPRIMSSNPKGVQVAYRRPPGPYMLDNLGYMIVKLPRIKDERKIPDRVDVNVVLNILYDIGAGLGVGEIGKNIPQLTEDEFLQDKSKYSFWSGRGYVKADLIEDNKAVFTIYDGRLQKARAGLSLTPGQESGEISLNAGYFFPGYGEEAISRNLRERFKLKLDSISVPRDKAKLEIFVNNKFITEELSENQRLYEGSSWKIKKVETNEAQDRVELFNEETKELSTITGNKIYVFDCTRFNTKELCEEYPECTFDTSVTPNVCKPKAEQIISANIVANTDFWKLVVVASLEDSDSQGRADVAQSVYNRLAAGGYGNTIGEILISTGQYQPVFEDPKSSVSGALIADIFKKVVDKNTAINAYKEQKEKITGSTISDADATKEIEDTYTALTSLTYQREAALFVDSRTDFRADNWNGVSIVERNSGDNAFGFGKDTSGYNKFFNPDTNIIAPASPI